MRMHIELDDELVRELDAVAGSRGRSAYVRAALRSAIDADRRMASLMSVAGAMKDDPHEWDDDPAAWVGEQRRLDARRVG